MDRFDTATPLKPPTGPKCAGGSGPSQDTTAGPSGQGGQGSPPAQAPQAPSQPSTPASPPSAQGVDMAAGPSSSPSGNSVTPPTSNANAPPAPPVSSSPPSNAAPASSAAGSTTCTSPGQIVCSPDKRSIGTCDQAGKAVMMPVPAGTQCSPNGIAWSSKRSRVYRRAH